MPARSWGETLARLVDVRFSAANKTTFDAAFNADPTYTLTGITVDRTLDTGDALVNTIDVLGTLINDLKAKGILS